MKKTIADLVSKKINNGEVSMKSQLSMLIEKIKIDGGIAILFAILTLIAGFIFYWINSNNDLLFGGYGKYGISSFLQSFPYVFVIGFILLFILLIFIFRTFDFSYKKPFLLILLFVTIGTLVIGLISIKQPVSQQIYQRGGRFLRMGMMNNSNAITGNVVAITSKRISIQNSDNNVIIINTNTTTHFPFGNPKVGDQIRAVGLWNDTIFTAIGVRVFDETNPSTLRPGMMRGQGQGRGMMLNR